MNTSTTGKVLKAGLATALAALAFPILMGGCPDKDSTLLLRYVNMVTMPRMVTSTAKASVDMPAAQYKASTTGYYAVGGGRAEATVYDKDMIELGSIGNPGQYNHVYNLIALGNDETLEYSLLESVMNHPDPAAGTAEIHFVHGVEVAGVQVDVYVVPVGSGVAGTPVATGLAYTHDQSTVLPSVGTYDFVSCFAGTNTEMFRTTVTVESGRRYISVLVSPPSVTGSFKTIDWNNVV